MLLLQLLSIIFMILGLIFFIQYQKLAKKEDLHPTNKKVYQQKEVFCFYIGIILEVLGLILLMFI